MQNEENSDEDNLEGGEDYGSDGENIIDTIVYEEDYYEFYCDEDQSNNSVEDDDESETCSESNSTEHN